MIDLAIKYFKENHLALLGMVAAVGLALYQARKSRTKKSISYEIKSKTQLFTINDKNAGKLEILFDGKPVRDAHVLMLSIMNTGDEPIRTSDYEEALEVTFPSDVTILSVAVIVPNTKNLRVDYELSKHAVKLDKILLNQKESIMMKLILDNNSRDPSVSARIVGITEITKYVSVSNKFKSILHGNFLFFAAIICLMTGNVLIQSSSGRDLQGWIGAALLFFGVALFLVHFFSEKIFSKSRKGKPL